MGDFVHKENTGSAFKNRDKTEDWHADYKGKINVAGTLHFLDVYVNKTGSGDTYFGVRIGPKMTKQQPADYPKAEKPQEPEADPEFDDDIPF